MWWPALGAIVVGVVGLVEPRTLGVGYDNIEAIAQRHASPDARCSCSCVLKFVSWSISLGSGTSGGTLAPLFTIGGGLGALLGALVRVRSPALGVDPRVAALVGMAAIFAGASHALLASVVFAFETTRQPIGLLPLLAGCSAAYLSSLLLMRHSIMTEKLARRGTSVRTEYSAGPSRAGRVCAIVRRAMSSRCAATRRGTVRAWLASGAGGRRIRAFPCSTRGQLSAW